jgi:MSHA biogenesis protein MshP
MLTTHLESGRQTGFAIVSAIFILVALAALGAAIAVVSSVQHVGSAFDLEGARAYQDARSGSEWGVANALAVGCVPAAANFLAGNGMTVTVTCVALAQGGAVEVGLGAIYSITATACNQPAAAGSCPGDAAAPNYVERRLTVLAER